MANFNKESSSRVRVVWHRRDLRLHDNFLYSNCEIVDCQDPSVSVVSLYVFDDEDFQPRPSTCRPHEWDAVSVGPHAARGLLESIHALRQALRSIGGELIVRKGSPAAILPEIIQQVGATEVDWNEEPGFYEQRQSKAVWNAIRRWYPKLTIQTSMQYTLYHPDDLPVGGTEWDQLAQPNKTRSSKKKKSKKQKASSSPSPSRRGSPSGMVDISQERWKGMCKIMGDFRKAARQKTKPRPCLPAPEKLLLPAHLQNVDSGEIPSLQELLEPLSKSTNRPILGIPHATITEIIEKALEHQAGEQSGQEKSTMLQGGEEAGLKHLAECVEPCINCHEELGVC